MVLLFELFICIFIIMGMRMNDGVEKRGGSVRPQVELDWIGTQFPLVLKHIISYYCSKGTEEYNL